jgi:hypothetical protein
MLPMMIRRMILTVFIFCGVQGLQIPIRTRFVPVTHPMPTMTHHSYIRTGSSLFADLKNVNYDEDSNVPAADEKKKSFFGKIFNAMKPKSGKNMSTKEMLAKMGLSTLLSYGFVSNMSMGACVTCSWYTFARKTGLSPLAPNQWKGFLGVYAGFYVINNFLRPFRIAASIAISKYFDEAITNIQTKTKLPRAAAIATVVFLANVVGTCTVMGGGK